MNKNKINFESAINKNIASVITEFLTLQSFLSISLTNKKNFKVFFENEFAIKSLKILQNLKENSTILKDLSQLFWLLLQCENFQEEDYTIKLLYRASRDGFRSEIFHSKCDNFQPILVVILNYFDKKFGGYANASFDKNLVNKYIGCVKSEAFLFSIDNYKVYKIKKNCEKSALFYKKHRGPIFGKDLIIWSDCDENDGSTTLQFGEYFHSDNNLDNNWEALSGGKDSEGQFRVKDYEVYHFQKL